MRRETADAEQRAAQLEAELQRMIRAHTEREEDLDRKMDNLNRHALWLKAVPAQPSTVFWERWPHTPYDGAHKRVPGGPVLVERCF